MKRFLALLLLTFSAGIQTTSSALTVPKYSKFEASFTLSNQTGNPYNPQENDVDADIHGPASTNVVVPAFWDGTCWRVRFAPTRTGHYRLTIVRNGATVTPPDLTASSFTCTPSSDPGYIRVDPRHPLCFVFDNGQPYYPLGMDVAWTGGSVPPYPQMLPKLGAAHMNWARVWMNAWDNKNLEWASDKANNPPIGAYYQDAAKQWDAIFDSAAQNGVYIQMTLQHHGEYTAQVDPNWNDNPFNSANGGFLQKPDDFFTNPEAIALTRAKYRYIVARWGYSTHLLSFELFNEVQNIREASGHFDDVVNWHKTMAATIRSIDVDHHLITTSNSDPGNSLSNIGLDYDQVHIYTPDVASYFGGLGQNGATVPVFVGEWGPTGPDANQEQTIHDALWASIMAPVSGAGQFWSWDQVVANNWWPIYRSATGYVDGFQIEKLTDVARASVQVLSNGTRADLSFNPPGGWMNDTKTEATIPSDGSSPDLSGMSYFIQGTSHRDMMPKPLSFNVTASQDCQFKVDVGNVSENGSHLVLALDGTTAAEADFPKGNKTGNQEISITVPAGSHIVSLDNTGVDWFTVNKLIITNFAPNAGVMAKGNSHGIAFWAYGRDRKADTPIDATLLLRGLAPGKVRVRLWDTGRGVELKAPAVVRQDGTVAIKLSQIDKDVAGVATVE